jgi:thioredoxin 1
LGNTTILRTADFEREVLEAEGIVLVDFFAPWCPPCKRLEPELEMVANELGESIKIVKVDVDQDEPLSLQYNVQKIPNMTFFRDGKVIDQHVGLLLKRDILARVQRLSEQVGAK